MKNAILALAAMAVSGTAVAGPAWTYADFGYLRASSGAEDADGYQVRGSIGFADMWHAQAEYLDAEEGNEDIDGFNIVVGANPSVNDTTDLFFDINYFDYDVGTNSSVDGYGLGTGVRTMWSDALEFNAGVWVLDADSDAGGDSTNVVVGVGGNYAFTDNIAVGVDIRNGTEVASGNVANFFARFNF